MIGHDCYVAVRFLSTIDGVAVVAEVVRSIMSRTKFVELKSDDEKFGVEVACTPSSDSDMVPCLYLVLSEVEGQL